MSEEKEKNQDEKARAIKIIKILDKEYPNVKPALKFSNPFELLIATILSAQCTDERVNKVTQKLFKKYSSPIDYLSVPDEELQKDIYSTGFYKNKSRNIKACCSALIEEYGGEVPADFEALVKLPGVGRKTAAVVAGNAFGIPAIAVDTHVLRLSNLLGFVNTRNAKIIEFKLMKLLPKKYWINTTHLFMAHGRKICIARRPKCQICKINKYCPSFSK